MFDQLFDGFRKVSEFSLQMQQEALKTWSQQWFSAPSAPGEDAADWGRTTQKRWADFALELLNRHRASIDSAYNSGIQLIEQTFRASVAKSPDEYRQTVEELWRKLFETFKDQSEAQLREFQKLSEKSIELAQYGR